MSYRKRMLMLIIALELALAYFYLYAAGLPGTPEQIAQRGSMIGTVMGVILGLTPLLYLMARKNDLKNEKAKSE